MTIASQMCHLAVRFSFFAVGAIPIAQAQDSWPVRIAVPHAPGGLADEVSRVATQEASAILRKQSLIDIAEYARVEKFSGATVDLTAGWCSKRVGKASTTQEDNS